MMILRLSLKSLLLLVFACSVHLAHAEPESGVKWITGSKPWRMKDGGVQRMKLVRFSRDGKYGIFQKPMKAGANMPLSEFAQEEQDLFAAIMAGKLKLVTTPGLCMSPDFPVGRLSSDLKNSTSASSYKWYGETRVWVNTEGKSVTARLVCITDEDVSLRIADSFARVRLNNLSPADLAYIERLKRGEAKLFADEVWLNVRKWDGAPPIKYTVSGEHYAALAERNGDFEGALAAALRHVKSKLGTANWQLEIFSEEQTSALVHPPVDNAKAEGRTAYPCFYVATFNLTKESEKEARRHWPLNMTPPSWGDPHGLNVCVLADGEIADVQLIPEN